MKITLNPKLMFKVVQEPSIKSCEHFKLFGNVQLQERPLAHHEICSKKIADGKCVSASQDVNIFFQPKIRF